MIELFIALQAVNESIEFFTFNTLFDAVIQHNKLIAEVTIIYRHQYLSTIEYINYSRGKMILLNNKY